MSVKQLSQIVDEFKGKISSETVLHPLVIVPSLIGNALDAKLSGDVPPHWFCSRYADWYRIFIDSNEFYPIAFDCWVHNIQLNYNESGYFPNDGVSIRAPDYGNLSSTMYLDTAKTYPVWVNIVNTLVALGYTPGQNLRAAPYDWRLGPDSTLYSTIFSDLKNLIEDTYTINQNTTVAVTSLSMGGSVFNLFLTTVSQEWKDKYIHSFSPLSSCFGGSVSAAVSVLGLPVYGVDFRSVLDNWGSVLWLLPYKQLYANKVVVSTPSKNYTISDIESLFTDAGLLTTGKIYKNILPYQITTPPGVPTNCIIGNSVPTLESITFLTGNWFGGASTNTFVGGDGTCQTESLDFCSVWQTQQKQPVTTHSITGMQHSEVLVNPEALRILVKILLFS